MRPGEKTIKPSSNAQIKDLWLKIREFSVKRFGFVFIVLSLFSLTYAAFSVQQELQNGPIADGVSSSRDWSASFNKQTIQKINALGSQNSSPLPAGRTNPFSE
ncbi:hypothetical protein EOL73_03725 [Candidatus Saccharibacteria bacterium]|nr:hypothetical protein [Candidatus Saccharibacteria bacterium]NCU40838.1 hypothetical protein [Candidatus Saccharibacteria bacterium]